MSALKYWIWMANLGKGNHASFLLERFGAPELVYAAQDAAYDELPLPGYVRQGLKEKSLKEAEGILEDCRRLGIRVLTYADTEYPERLRQIEQPPCVLYVKGQLPQIDDDLAIAIVGARKATPYGESAARRLATELARQGALLVSGIAHGVDSAAIKGAISGGGTVLSVLGNGIDVAYPASSKSLYEDIPKVGALLSEYPPGTAPDAAHFPPRNRIISGLALGTVVVEAAQRSGALITARHALEQNRDVFAVPGGWDAPLSQGTNLLIQKGEAKLVLKAWDILEEYSYTYSHKIQQRPPLAEKDYPPREKKRPEAEKSAEAAGVVIDLNSGDGGLTDDEQAILFYLQSISANVDELIEASGLPAKRVLSVLTMLQVRGLVEEAAGKRFHTPVTLLGYEKKH